MTIQEVNATISDIIFFSYQNMTLLPVSSSAIQNAFDALGLINLSNILQYEVSK